jgi:hypothetical protein
LLRWILRPSRKLEQMRGPRMGPDARDCHSRFQRAELGASHMCARIYFHTYVDVTSVIYQKDNA